LLLIDKPPGVTSHDVVDAVRRALSVRKVGHAGTLDPMATGLMLVCVGRATRLLRYLSGLGKSYEGSARLGVETDTLDAEGAVLSESEVDVGEPALLAAFASLTGEIEQIPPAHSAVKVGGRKLYEAARKGEVLEAPPRQVRIDSYELVSFASPSFDFRVACSSGTYIRSLVADTGRALDCGAHLTALRRTAIARFTVAEATTHKEPGEPLPMERIVAHLPARTLDAAEAEAVSHGRPLLRADLHGPYAVFHDGALLAVYEDGANDARAQMVLPEVG
jgi:tRNA pseudouridine55 synthase